MAVAFVIGMSMRPTIWISPRAGRKLGHGRVGHRDVGQPAFVVRRNEDARKPERRVHDAVVVEMRESIGDRAHDAQRSLFGHASGRCALIS